MGTSRITTESLAAESILCANLCWQQRLINEHVSKQIQQEPAQGRKVLVEKDSKMKAISSYVPALRTMQQDKTAANPNPPKTNQHEENCYKVHGYKSNHYRKQCSRIHSVSKFELTTAVDK